MHRIPLFAITLMVACAPFATNASPILQSFPDPMTSRMSMPGLLQVQETKGKYQEEIAKKEAIIAEILERRDNFLEQQWINPTDPVFVLIWSRLIKVKKERFIHRRRLPERLSKRQKEEALKLEAAEDAARERLVTYFEETIKRKSGHKETRELATSDEDFLSTNMADKIVKCRVEIDDLKKKS